jgi:hypothetical protein
MLKPFVAERAYLAIFVLRTNPEQLVLVRSREDTSGEWHLPYIDIDEFASPEAGVQELLRMVGLRGRRNLSFIKQGRVDGVAVASYRVNLTPEEADKLGGTDDYHVMIIGKDLLKGVDGNGYLARSQRALLCP